MFRASLTCVIDAFVDAGGLDAALLRIGRGDAAPSPGTPPLEETPHSLPMSTSDSPVETDQGYFAGEEFLFAAAEPVPPSPTMLHPALPWLALLVLDGTWFDRQSCAVG